MKVGSYPPFVVFFDTVAILLFVLILNQSGEISFNIPEDRLFSGARLVYPEGDGFNYLDTGEIVDTISPDVLYMAPCGQQPECIEALRSAAASDVRILFPESLTSEISKISTLAIKSGCTSIASVVGIDGVLDRSATLAANPCMQTIPGVQRWLNRQR